MSDKYSGNMFAVLVEDQFQVIEDERYKDIKIGDIIEIEGNLRTPGAARNPSEFDYQKYLKNKCKNSIKI